MKFTVSKMKAKSPIVRDNIIEQACGYSFIDEFGCCIIIAYGEKEMKAMCKYLKSKIL